MVPQTPPNAIYYQIDRMKCATNLQSKPWPQPTISGQNISGFKRILFIP